MRIPMTVKGAAQLRAELQRLKQQERPRIIRAIAEAREHGDLKENAEYHAAREQQSFTEGRISHLESQLANAQVIDITNIKPTGKVMFGATVELLNISTEERVVYTIVGDEEADIQERKISLNSPMARSVMGKEIGEVVPVQTPSGTIEYEIEEVEHR